MSIVSSSYQVGDIQKDGQRWIDELHVDSIGETHRVSYQAIPGYDMDAQLARRVSIINTALADAEAVALLLEGT
jgi:hypothetical protein